MELLNFLSSILNNNGLFGQLVDKHPFIWVISYSLLISHVTISAMSLSFHRYHTHKGVIIKPALDYIMQLHLWLVTSLNRLDWAAVHLFHHTHSDQELDPHSPVQKGIMHVLFLGVFDYTKAKSHPEVVKIRKSFKTNAFERYLFKHSFQGPIILTLFLIFIFGPLWGVIFSIINFLVSPIFAVGGVNALAHYVGYKNHRTLDNSRNLGYVFPLNFIICGELDHNNHHAIQTSCSFRHRWFEFDIGYVYLKILNIFNLAHFKSVYNCASLKQELQKQMKVLLEKDNRFKKRFEELAIEFNTNYAELKNKVERYLSGEKIKLDKSVKVLLKEMKRTVMANRRLQLNY